MPYKIALTSSDGKTIDQHFGETETFLIFDVDDRTGSWRFNELRTLPPESCGIISGGEGPPVSTPAGSGCAEATGGFPVHCCGHRDERMKLVTGLLSDCRYVLTALIGKKPHMLLQREGITALESPADIPYAISKLHRYHIRFDRINREKENLP